MAFSTERILVDDARQVRRTKFALWVFFVVPLASLIIQVYLPLFQTLKFISRIELPLLVTIYFALMRRSQIAPEEARFRRSYTLYDPEDLTSLVGPDLAVSVDSVIDQHAAIYNDNDLDDEVNRMCLADTRLFMAGLNLTYTDRASMAASVEVRTPFVDRRVARAAFSIKGSDKIRGRTAKAALKDAAENWLPHEIVHRPKASFGAPLRAWVRNDLRELINDVLVGGELTQLGMLRKDQVRRLIADEQAGREDYAKQIWQLLSMELWYRQVRAAGRRVVTVGGNRQLMKATS